MGADKKTIAGVLERVWGMGWVRKCSARELMEECGYDSKEKVDSRINGKVNYIVF